MAVIRVLAVVYLAMCGVYAKSSSTDASADASKSTSKTTTSSTDSSAISTFSSAEPTTPTGSYISYSTTIDLTTTGDWPSLSSSTSTSSSSSSSKSHTSGGSNTGTMTFSTLSVADNTTSSTTTKSSKTYLTGTNSHTTSVPSNSTLSRNATASSTSSSAQATNTTPCNGYPELCNRKFGNITEVCAHNSPFVKAGNAAANQALPVTTQLNDGIRMLQAQAHLVNGTLYLCHTSCDILNAGTLQSYLTTVNSWVETHPYDVVTILLGNGDYSNVGNFTAPIINSGLGRFVYEPPKMPMGLDDWPTLASMIISGKRVVVFMDYQANQTAVPYILDEFSQMWETPFDPTNASFPCNVQRPPNLSPAKAKQRMYMTNHNLNVEISLMGSSLLVPATTLLNVTNNVTGDGSLGQGAQICIDDWGRAPNRLNVDFYNVGDGSVFEVAAKLNNVTYNGKCCGSTSAGTRTGARWVSALLAGVTAMWMLL